MDEATYEILKRKNEKIQKLEGAIKKHLPALKKMAQQIIDPKDNVFSRMVRDFEEAIK